jgi:preprotein translocase subunit SecD
MNRRTTYLIIIFAILAFTLWASLPSTTSFFGRPMKLVLGLDLQGGIQILLEANVPADQAVDADSLEVARQILEQRANGLGVSEATLQTAGDRRIVGEFPGYSDSQTVRDTIGATGVLEFVDTGDTRFYAGDPLVTSYNKGDQVLATGTVVYNTIMTGDQLKSVSVVTDKLGNYEVSFELKDQGASIFATHTANNIDKYLTLVLDKTVISSPVISAAITDGSGVISGKFTAEEANALAVQLRYGSLPIAMKIVEDRTIGPTLGKDSLDKSLLAGVIGFFIVVLFMIIFYRVPGVVAIAAIIIYGLITFTLYKFIPVTLTLPGIAGLLLSTGGALDANILIFERMKEELRSGRNLKQASELGWKRAWSSIRDSNLATLITSGILFWFGSSFGATIVKGFAVTLALGVIISLFAATFITRTLLSVVVDWFSKSTNYQKWFGA